MRSRNIWAYHKISYEPIGMVCTTRIPMEIHILSRSLKKKIKSRDSTIIIGSSDIFDDENKITRD